MLWKGFQKPKQLEFDQATLTKTYGKFHAQPYERGSDKSIGGWYAGSFGWPASEAGSSLMEERARRKSLVEQWLTLNKKPLTAAHEKRLRSPTELVAA